MPESGTSGSVGALGGNSQGDPAPPAKGHLLAKQCAPSLQYLHTFPAAGTEPPLSGGPTGFDDHSMWLNLIERAEYAVLR
jgi:hypothetical protein